MIIFKELGLYEGEEPSSKRIFGAIILVFTMTMFAIDPKMEWNTLITWLGAGLTPLGITGWEKVKAMVANNKANNTTIQ